MADQSAAAKAIQAGRQHYAAKRYKPALEQFTRAMKQCPCTRGMRRERCSCKAYEDVASKNGSIFKEAMYNCKCSVGQTFNKCDKDNHIQALDYRAATFEAMGELDRARRDADWMLELAPRRLDGYLRLGKIARLQKKHQFAWKIYDAGIETGFVNGDTSSAKMQQLIAARQPLQKRYATRDPIELPLEIVLMIFSHVDFATFVRCLRVSKVWNRSLTSHGIVPLWRALVFGSSYPHRAAPSTSSLRKLIANSGNDVRQIIIKDASRFHLTMKRFSVLLQGSPNLEFLELRAPLESIHVREPFVCKTLRQLVLDGFDRRDFEQSNIRRAPFPFSLLKSSTGGLRSLHIVGVPAMLELSVPQMHCLKHLRLEQPDISNAVLPIFDLLTKMSDLEKLWLHNVPLRSDVPEGLQWSKFLKKLNTIVILFHFPRDGETLRAIMRLLSVGSGSTLRNIDLSISGWDVDDITGRRLILTTDGDPTMGLIPANELPKPNNFKNLESLRLEELNAAPEKLQVLVADALANDLIHTFDIQFPPDDFETALGRGSSIHLSKYDWLRGASSIRSMGLYNFRFAAYPRNDDDLPLPRFLASFSNLETLEIDTEHYEDGELCTVIKSILEATQLKAIYQSNIHGVHLDQLRVLTASHNVELIWGKRPREWTT